MNQEKPTPSTPEQTPVAPATAEAPVNPEVAPVAPETAQEIGVTATSPAAETFQIPGAPVEAPAVEQVAEVPSPVEEAAPATITEDTPTEAPAAHIELGPEDLAPTVEGEVSHPAVAAEAIVDAELKNLAETDPGLVAKGGITKEEAVNPLVSSFVDTEKLDAEVAADLKSVDEKPEAPAEGAVNIDALAPVDETEAPATEAAPALVDKAPAAEPKKNFFSKLFRRKK